MELPRCGLEQPHGPEFDLGLTREPTACFAASSMAAALDWKLAEKPQSILASRSGEQTSLRFLAGVLSTSQSRHSPEDGLFAAETGTMARRLQD